MTEPQTIDYTRTHWGHNLDGTVGMDGVFRGFCWATPGPKAGDLMKWKTNYGTATARVTEAKWTVNVDDMYVIAAEVIDRQATTA